MTTVLCEPKVADRPTVAIVGSGPAGCYTAQMLRKRWPDAPITVFDRLPVPYGLLRYGVSPDHQGTKKLTRQFDRMFTTGGVNFVGNIEIGRSLSVDQLRAAFDVVVLATGLSADRQLPGVAGRGVHGAGQVMRWFNAHPDELFYKPSFGNTTTIVGTGNVGMDVVRLLAKHPDSFGGSDLDPTLLHDRPTRIHVVGRSSAAESKFDAVMVRELSAIEDAVFDADALVGLDHEDERKRARVRALADLVTCSRVSEPRVRVSFHFGWIPVADRRDGAFRPLVLTDTTSKGRTRTLLTDSLVTAVGFGSGLPHEIDRAVYESARSDIEVGVLDDGLYCVGWFRRGSTGGIPDNRQDAKLVAGRIVSDVESARVKGSKAGIAGLAGELPIDAVDFEAWTRIDAVESTRQQYGRCRTKIPDRATMLAVARS